MGSIGHELQAAQSKLQSKKKPNPRKQFCITKGKNTKSEKHSKKKEPKSKRVLTEAEKAEHSYPLISNSTFETIMGKERWNRLLAYCKAKFEAKEIIAGYTGLGPELYCNSPLGKRIGLMSDILPKADKFKPKKKKK